MRSGWTIVIMTIVAINLFSETQYKIKSGETVYSIARSYNLSAQDILRANSISDPTDIGIGTNLIIPNTTGSKATQSTHTVQKGDTYFSIAKRNDVSLSALLALNNRSANQILRIGEVLRVAPANIKTDTNKEITTKGNATKPASPPIGRQSLPGRVAATNGNRTWPHGGKRTAVRGKFPAIVIDASEGDVVRAVTGGRVVHIDSNGAFGKVIFVQSQTGHIFIYGGNEDTLVNIGDRITAGALVGRVGAERVGADTSHVYFSVWYNNAFVDPTAAPRG